jgi:hypothetical protein
MRAAGYRLSDREGSCEVSGKGTSMNCPPVEFLAEELKKLVGWGAKPSRLATLPNLRVFANLLPEPSVGLRRDGLLILNRLTTAINGIAGTIEFHDVLVPAEKLRWAVRVLLQIEGSGQSAEVRRAQAINLLGLAHRYGVSTWRHPEGPEWTLMLLVAQHLVASVSQT